MPERIYFVALCRQGPHSAREHHPMAGTCECPCHGGEGPWWADIQPAALRAITATPETGQPPDQNGRSRS